MSEDLHLLSQLIRALNEDDHPGLRRLGDLLGQNPLDPKELRRLCKLLSDIPSDDPVRSGEIVRCQLGARIVLMALDREEPWFSSPAAQRQLADACRALRFHGLALPEALVALLGARWLRSHHPAWALEMAQRAERILKDLSRVARLQGRPHPELQEAARQAQQLIREILHGPLYASPEETSKAHEAPEPAPEPSAPASDAATPPERPIPAPGWPLRPAKLFLGSLTLLPDTHPQAGDLQFLDPQTAGRLFDEMEVLIETLKVGDQIYQPYVEKDMEPIVHVRLKETLLLRVEGQSMQNAGIESGDLILAERVPGMEARDPSFWVSLEGRLVLAVLLERYQTEAHQAFLIKRLTRRDGRWWLCSENPGFEEIPLEPGLNELHPVLAILKPVA
ncbi:MAG: S24 family peptidase [Anaerolineae bacterium]|uniref:LexA family protein n=1 Tax=Thermoflexus sp. TaxID=1969742 RepID=UPI0025CCF1F3|nr:S24 family peptidase [Thermoflexus sp.]MCS7351136.1 S24 family peptidase [Thermoflexus sp.]MDW8180589.1 S24 family peptidase [Anaerolineae bacterium]